MGRIKGMVQGSPEWHALRATKITATMASSIVGLNPYMSSLALFNQLTGIEEAPPPNEAMIRGSTMEAEALAKFMKDSDLILKPAVFVSDTHPWAMCSLDGVTDDGRDAIEIKCGKKAFNDFFRKGIIAPYYLAQMQHQMWVCNFYNIIYCCYNGVECINTVVTRDQEFIDDMVKKEEAFFRDWQNLKPPTIETTIWDIPYEEYISQCEQSYKDQKC